VKVPRSLQGRLLALLTGLVLLVWGGMAAWTWADARHELDELLDAHLAQAAALLVAQQSLEIDDAHDLDAPILHRYAPKVAFQVFHEGRLGLKSANAPTEPLGGDPRSFRQGFRTLDVGGRTWRVFATGGAEADVQVYVGEQASSRSDILWGVLRSTLAPMLVALPLLALAAWVSVARVLAPLHRLGDVLARRRPEELQPIALHDASSEMTPLLDALNQLLERIATLLDAERRFTADAAHELRTPIAAIRAQAQVALAERDDEAVRRHALESTLKGCDRAARLVEQLLTLSRLEADTAPRTRPVDVGAVARAIVAELAPVAVAKGQSVQLEATPGCIVSADETLLGVLVRNLVDNAVRYSPRGARIEVGVTPSPGAVAIDVQDSGPGLPEAQLQRLGERFFRMPGNEESGSGLGWSIVRRIATALGADLDARRSRRLGGLDVCVRFKPPVTPGHSSVDKLPTTA
jgi:two-component system sensor histidine kinase QseC